MNLIDERDLDHRKKVDSRCVLENVLMGCGGACIGMKVTKGLCKEEFRLGDGLKMRSMKMMMFRMKSKD
ncbi:hypothetical protein Tco_0326742 [Tanacetum coccineum]